MTLLLLICISGYSQIIPFKQRASKYSPSRKVYQINGDYTMIGNTNLTRKIYSDILDNNYSEMKYIDTDNDPSTFNSSSANLKFSTENNANPNCSNIIYAGLYWTGKSDLESNTFTDSIVTGQTTINNNLIVTHNQNIQNTNFNLSVGINNPNSNNTSPVYTFVGNDKTYVFNYTNDTNINMDPIISVTIDGISQPDIFATETIDGDIVTATLFFPYIISEEPSVKIYSFVRNINTNLNLESTQSSSEALVNFSGTINTYSSPKLFEKRVVYLKGPNATSYKKVIANDDSIFYPSGVIGQIIPFEGIFVGYSEITDYVKTNGVGEYFVADIALKQGGQLDGIGHSGGWGIIVVYENAKMKSRDISIFDGYAFVKNNAIETINDLPISGFNTNLSGNVGIKLGIMASEGDVGIVGDYFAIQKTNSDYLRLNHLGNTANNYFNSSINIEEARNPSLVNNTGIDISINKIQNTNNSVIGNNQTSVNFRYGTLQDSYTIFSIAMAVDSYFPKIESTITVTTLNNSSTIAEPYSILPGQEIGFNLNIKNLSTEAIQDSKFIIPIPFNASYVSGSALGTILNNAPTTNNVFFDPTLGSNGSLVWDFGNLSLPANPNTILAKLNFKLKATQNCSILINTICGSKIHVNGFLSGKGTISGVTLSNKPFIKGYTTTGACIGDPIYASQSILINGANYLSANCPSPVAIRNFIFPNTNATIAVNQIANNFPDGILFYDSFPVTTASIAYNVSNPFPLNSQSGTMYYGVPTNENDTCYYPFTISKQKEIVANDDVISIQSSTSINTNAGNVLLDNDNGFDSLDNLSLIINNVNLNIVTGAIAINGNPVPTINEATGLIIIPAGTAIGTYSIVYKICEKENPTNCDTATVTINVLAVLITANDDFLEGECSSNGIVGSVLNNDVLSGNPISTTDVSINLISTENPNIILNTSTGEISISDLVSVGTYNLEYEICQTSNPTNCDIASIQVNCKDTTKPLLPILTDVIDSCAIVLTPPTTIDNCSGTITATTEDPLMYDTYGSYVIHWKFEDESGNFDIAIQNVIIKSTSSNIGVINNSDLADCNNDIDKVIDLNTLLPDNTPSNGIWVDVENSNGLIGFEFRPFNIPVAIYLFKYIFSENGCFKSISVNMKVSEDCGVKSGSTCIIRVYNSFSPNNDSSNEYFEIKNIEDPCVLSNHVQIYNRWGVLVYETNNYDNKTNVFTGRSKGRATMNESADLPTGTYFYIVNYSTIEGNKREDGYLYLSR